MSSNWYSDPYRHPLPYECASLNNNSAYDPPPTAYHPAFAQYTPLRIAPSANVQYEITPVQTQPTVQLPRAENGDIISNKFPTREGSERLMREKEAAKKRKHDEERGGTADGKRSRVEKAQASASPYTPDDEQSYQQAYNPGQEASTNPGQALAQPSPGPLLPGAERYLQRQLAQSPAPSSQDTARPRHTPRPNVPMASERSAHFAEGSKRIRIASRAGHSTSDSLYPTLPQQGTEPSAPRRGTQHNPFELDSSPERAPKSRPPKTKKKKFYAVAIGHKPGIYEDWADVEQQVKGWSGAKHKSFESRQEAMNWYDEQLAMRFGGQPNREEWLASDVAKQQAALRLQQASNRLNNRTTEQHSRIMDMTNAHLGAASPYAITSPTLSSSPPRAAIPKPSADPEPVLTPEQQKVVDLILQGHNVFYTGSAGCGKSTILKAFVKQFQAQGKRVKIVAPTNLAALNVGGVTTWSFAGWTPDSLKKPLDKLMQAAHGKEVWERFHSVDVLVIDEISMVENLMFERLNEIMKASLGEERGGGPFGGVQIVVTGDFCQLSPVKPFQYCIGCGWVLERDNKYRPKEYRCENKYCREDIFYDIDKWAFRSKAWEECKFKHINLTEIHRQSDKKFISILQHIRLNGVILQPHANILLNHTSETENAILLFARRDDVDRVNNENIARLPADAVTYKCLDHFDFKDHHRDDTSLEKNTRVADDGTLTALKEHRYEVNVQLKKGMRVVLQANLDPNGGLVNGSQGVITDFEPFDDKRLPRKLEMSRTEAAMSTSTAPSTRGAHARYFEEQIKIYSKHNKRQSWPIVQFDNGVTKTIFADCTASELGNEEPYSLLSRTQIPLMAGYAITVHKSQGMTLDRVIVDLSRAFEPSQIYVALSRARALKGLKVVGLPRTHLGGANAQVKEFFETYLRNKPAE